MDDSPGLTPPPGYRFPPPVPVDVDPEELVSDEYHQLGNSYRHSLLPLSDPHTQRRFRLHLENKHQLLDIPAPPPIATVYPAEGSLDRRSSLDLKRKLPPTPSPDFHLSRPRSFSAFGGLTKIVEEQQQQPAFHDQKSDMDPLPPQDDSTATINPEAFKDGIKAREPIVWPAPDVAVTMDRKSSVEKLANLYRVGVSSLDPGDKDRGDDESSTLTKTDVADASEKKESLIETVSLAPRHPPEYFKEDDLLEGFEDLSMGQSRVPNLRQPSTAPETPTEPSVASSSSVSSPTTGSTSPSTSGQTSASSNTNPFESQLAMTASQTSKPASKSPVVPAPPSRTRRLPPVPGHLAQSAVSTSDPPSLSVSTSQSDLQPSTNLLESVISPGSSGVPFSPSQPPPVPPRRHSHLSTVLLRSPATPMTALTSASSSTTITPSSSSATPTISSFTDLSDTLSDKLSSTPQAHSMPPDQTTTDQDLSTESDASISFSTPSIPDPPPPPPPPSPPLGRAPTYHRYPPHSRRAVGTPAPPPPGPLPPVPSSPPSDTTNTPNVPTAASQISPQQPRAASGSQSSLTSSGSRAPRAPAPPPTPPPSRTRIPHPIPSGQQSPSLSPRPQSQQSMQPFHPHQVRFSSSPLQPAAQPAGFGSAYNQGGTILPRFDPSTASLSTALHVNPYASSPSNQPLTWTPAQASQVYSQTVTRSLPAVVPQGLTGRSRQSMYPGVQPMTAINDGRGSSQHSVAGHASAPPRVVSQSMSNLPGPSSLSLPETAGGRRTASSNALPPRVNIPSGTFVYLDQHQDDVEERRPSTASHQTPSSEGHDNEAYQESYRPSNSVLNIARPESAAPSTTASAASSEEAFQTFEPSIVTPIQTLKSRFRRRKNSGKHLRDTSIGLRGGLHKSDLPTTSIAPSLPTSSAPAGLPEPMGGNDQPPMTTAYNTPEATRIWMRSDRPSYGSKNNNRSNGG